MSTMKGIDVSHWQGSFDVGSSGKDFVIAKATESTNFVDDHCDRFIQDAKKAGMKYGVYHFAEVGGTAEADWFVKNIQGYLGHALLALDWEADAVKKGPSAAKAFLDRVYDKTGVRPVLYTSSSVLSSYDFSAIAKADYGLWVARWADSPGSPSDGWKNFTLWQYADDLSIQGQRIDGDEFYGSGSTWDAYAAKGGKPAPAPDPEPKPKPDALPTVKVDGYWGSATTKLAQTVYGTEVDSEVWHQWSDTKKSNPGLTTGWKWDTTQTGSPLIKAIQKEFGVSDADGLIGPTTIKAIEKHYGTKQDGVFSGPSETVKALQRTWNEGKKK